MQALANIPRWGYAALGAVLVLVQILVLYSFGQPFIAATGRILLWVSDPLSPSMSQQLADWYSFSHIIHGFIFYGVLTFIMPRAPLGARLLGAMGIEIGWEILENTPMVIQAYRAQALAVGYAGDSILNSVSDTCMMILGFFTASKLRARYVVALAIAFELLTAYTIRDGLFLNILNFTFPIQAVHDWQAGAPR